MSSNNRGSGSEGAGRRLWCWACENETEIPATGTDIICGSCGSGAVEERETARSGLTRLREMSFVPPRLSARGSAAFSPFQSASGEGGAASNASSPDRHRVGSAAADSRVGSGDDMVERIRGLLMRRMLISMLGGEDEDGGGHGAHAGPLATLLGGGTLVSGDYAIGDISALIARLDSQLPATSGKPATAQSVIQALRHSHGTSASGDEECTVCQEALASSSSSQVMKLPCRHSYHEVCIMPWLEVNNMCPTCRQELPTDDLEYNTRHNLDIGRWLEEHGPA